MVPLQIVNDSGTLEDFASSLEFCVVITERCNNNQEFIRKIFSLMKPLFVYMVVLSGRITVIGQGKIIEC